jgi:hypothetical protein
MKRGANHDGPEEYKPLWEQWDGTDSKVTGPGGRPGPEIVATAIADAVADPTPPLRIPVGADAEMILATRQSLDDAAFEATMRKALDFDW